jgi:hypothetical protein
MSGLPVGLQPILFGLGALTYARHPEGVLEFNKRKSFERIQKIGAKFSKKAPSADGDGESGSPVVANAGTPAPAGGAS